MPTRKRKNDTVPTFERYYRVLQYLRENTDRDHPISLKKLEDVDDLHGYIWNDFAQRKQNIVDMACAMNADAYDESEWHLCFDEYEKRYGNLIFDEDLESEEEGVWTDDDHWKVKNLYYQHSFSNDEVKALVEAVQFSKSLDEEETSKLIKKIENKLTSKYNRDSVKVGSVREIFVDRAVLSPNLKLIQKAMERDRQIHFSFNHYDEKQKRIPHWESDVSPYEIVAYNGHYYLLGILEMERDEKKEQLWIGRIDLMSAITEIDKNRLSRVTVPDLPQKWDEKFLHSHLNMSYDTPRPVKLRVTTKHLTFLYDAFGRPHENFKIHDADENGDRIVELRCSPFGMVNFAMQYSDWVEVMEPDDVRSEVKEKIERLNDKYSKKICKKI